MIQAIVADDNSIIREMLVDTLDEDSDINVVATASNGQEAIDTIKECRPDVVLLDLIMPVIDGIGVMEEIISDNSIDKKPFFIVVSAAGKEDIVSQALGTGASYFFMKPFNGVALVRKVKQLCGKERVVVATETSSNESANGDNIDAQLTELMHRIFVPIKMVGYKYLKESIKLAIEDAEALMSITKNIYPFVAEKFGTSPGNVERNIRYVIEATWNTIIERNKDDIISDVFNGMNKKPTNSEFIVICSEWIRVHK